MQANKPYNGHRSLNKSKPYNKPNNNKSNHSGRRNYNKNQPKKLTPEEIEQRKQKRFEKLLQRFEKDSSDRLREYNSRKFYGKKKIMKARNVQVMRSKGLIK